VPVKPKFFCESCGEEVEQNAKICPHCGRFFASVKCPSCGYVGDARLFKKGCPVCGYAFKNDAENPGKGGGKNPRDVDPLPWWMFAIPLAVLIGLVAFIFLRS